MRDAPITSQPTVYASMDERDRALEARYTFDREGHTSTLAFVSQRQHELAVEYLDSWRPYHADNQGIRDALTRFEAWRFGAMLEPSAHSMLLFAVLWRAFPDDARYSRIGRAPDPLPDRKAGDPARLEAAVENLAEAREIPEDERMSNYEKNERERELRKQAEDL